MIGCADSMKGKVEQQEMELNVSNPRIFMEVQTASKEEVSRHRALYDWVSWNPNQSHQSGQLEESKIYLKSQWELKVKTSQLL